MLFVSFVMQVFFLLEVIDIPNHGAQNDEQYRTLLDNL